MKDDTEERSLTEQLAEARHTIADLTEQLARTDALLMAVETLANEARRDLSAAVPSRIER